MGSLSLADARRVGAGEAARQVLGTIPASASIVLHLDIDVVQERDLPAAYFPHTEGLSLCECLELLRVLARDPRVRVIEVSEYASLRDLERRHVSRLIDMLADALSPGPPRSD